MGNQFTLLRRKWRGFGGQAVKVQSFGKKEKRKISHRGHRDRTQRSRRIRGETQGLVQRGAELQDAGADGFYRGGERKGGGFVEEQDDAVQFTFTDAAS